MSKASINLLWRLRAVSNSTDSIPQPAALILETQADGCIPDLDRRGLFAAMLLQGILTGVEWDSDSEGGSMALLPTDPNQMIALSVVLADLLIERLNQT